MDIELIRMVGWGEVVGMLAELICITQTLVSVNVVCMCV